MPEPVIDASPGPGRPLKFENVDALQKSIDAYFTECDREEDTRIFEHEGEDLEEIPGIEKNTRVLRKRIVCKKCRRDLWSDGCLLVSGALKLRKPYTVTGLAVWLDTSRQTLLDYQFRKEFTDTILRAKQRIESYGEEKLYDKGFPTKGVIFSLSNNYERWAEKIEAKVHDTSDPVKELAQGLMDGAAEEADTPPDAAAPAQPAPAGSAS